VRWAAGRDDVALVTPAHPARRAGVVALRPRDPAGAAGRLAAAGVVHSVREGAVRLSPHGYNTPGEIDRALAALAAPGDG
jgi:selenocysteine lyase/cysteine desulfurase